MKHLNLHLFYKHRRLKIFLVAISLLTKCSILYGQSQQIEEEIVFFRKNLILKPTNVYLVKGDNAVLLNVKEGKIIFPDTITGKYIDLLVIYKNDKIGIPMFEYKESKYLHIYFDNRLCNNSVTKKFQEYSKRKYLFRKRYLIDSGLHYIIISKKLKKRFQLSNS